MKDRFPFSEFSEGDSRIRTFSGDIDPDELVWHRDAEDRKIVVLKSEGWWLQMDDRLPVPLLEGEIHFIPEGEWHRVIKRGSGRLVVRISHPHNGSKVATNFSQEESLTMDLKS